MKDSCQKAQDLIERYLDGELGRSRRIRVERHLPGCERCREKLNLLKLQGDILRERMETTAAEVDFSDFGEKVVARLRKETPPPFAERAVVWFREAVYHYRAVWIASLLTAAVLLLALVPLLSQPPLPVAGAPSGPAPQISQVDNEVIIDSMEYAGRRSMIYTVSKNNTTVIWLYDFDRAAGEPGQGDDI